MAFVLRTSAWILTCETPKIFLLLPLELRILASSNEANVSDCKKSSTNVNVLLAVAGCRCQSLGRIVCKIYTGIVHCSPRVQTSRPWHRAYGPGPDGLRPTCDSEKNIQRYETGYTKIIFFVQDGYRSMAPVNLWRVKFCITYMCKKIVMY
jgi:hypothetical protein